MRCVVILFAAAAMLAGEVHVWEKQEIALQARGRYGNPYLEVDVWVDLKGPGFARRVYGFWDGGATFRVRVLATAPGKWTWKSGSKPADPGLSGKTGSFTAVAWTESEKQANACRRGFIRPTANGHAFEQSDRTPFFLVGDTWWAVPTFRYRWFEDDNPRPAGPSMGFKDMVKLRKAQGYNSVAMIAAMPAWANDGRPAGIVLNDAEKTVVRGAWRQEGTQSAKDMHNEGGRAFLFPGKVPGYEDVFPDIERINPAYFEHMDKKIDYLNSQGFVPFIEVARRDLSQAWKKFYGWPESYARYIQYIFSRYQANNCLFSPIHFDTNAQSIPGKEYNAAANLVLDRWGAPPFGTLASTNASLSTLINFGGPEEARWLTFHQIGNWREHDNYWQLTEIFRQPKPMPALNGEPYYAGLILGKQLSAPGGSPEDDLYCRSGMYGSFLSGGFAGHIYGAQGMWGADVEDAAPVKMWEPLAWKSGDQMRHLCAFALSNGTRYRDLEPDADLVTPNKTHQTKAYTGWAYCARTRDKGFFLVYFEKDCPQGVVRGALTGRSYRARWFDPRTGEWIGAGSLRADPHARITLPKAPSEEDWALSLILE